VSVLAFRRFEPLIFHRANYLTLACRRPIKMSPIRRFEMTLPWKTSAAKIAIRYCANTSALDWHERLLCSRCGGRQFDMVVTETKR